MAKTPGLVGGSLLGTPRSASRPPNTSSVFRYLLVLGVVLLGAIYAAPNLFQPDSALQIRAVQEIAGDELVMTYIAERNGLPSRGQYDLPIELRFVRLDGKYRLKEGYLSKNLADILTDELLTQIMQSVCKSEKSLAKQQITIDIRTLDRILLPAGSEIIGILGPPNLKSNHRRL